MGFFDALLGRSKPPAANLDVLFALPQAVLTLQSAGFTFTGVGSVCYRAPEGAAFASLEKDTRQLIDADEGPPAEQVHDAHGFTWLVNRHEPYDVSGLVTEIHAINRGLEDAGFGASLLCSMFTFASPTGSPLGLVYLYKRGSFYPFAPLADSRRDNGLELQVRGLVADEVPIEPDLQRWFAVWGAPGMA
ncbi:MAG: hypothetical protein JWP10_1079 [Nocardioidaceae bacterium]|nr:hypothetical protein [Nocardioidaceae bacterium]